MARTLGAPPLTKSNGEKSGIFRASRLPISSVLRNRDEQGSAKHLEEHDNGGSDGYL
jgi:hypothetical protein